MLLTLEEARARVLVETRRLVGGAAPRVETIALDDAPGRVLARAAVADRDQPPFHRATRDGFAVRAVDVVGATPAAPVRLRVLGEVAAGGMFAGRVGAGECVEIMTGAPLPEGADAVIMVEDSVREPGAGAAQVALTRAAAVGESWVPAGSELAAGAVALPPGRRIDPGTVALLASLGCARVDVIVRPRVAILATGDEIVEVDQIPGAAQIRNSNARSLAAQVARAGGIPLRLPAARDDAASLRALIERGLAEADLLVLTGGVSMGKHDLVEPVLAELGARFHFTGVAVRPGKPAVFGEARGKPIFGLPGNPLSTLVTFELLARPALALLAGATATATRFFSARLAAPLVQKPLELTVFVPAALDETGAATPLRSQGSGDLAAMARADGFLELAPRTSRVEPGAYLPFLPI